MAHILVAEDEATVRDFVTRALGLAGYQVTAVTDGGAALEALKAQRFDLLLTDIVMPVMDGIALALAVARDHAGLPVLLMSGYPKERQRAHNMDVLVHDILAKPFTLDQLQRAVSKALAA
jgi:CheY-like chemotaxis protein